MEMWHQPGGSYGCIFREQATAISKESDELPWRIRPAEMSEIKICLPLAQPSAVRGYQQGNMAEFRFLEAQGAIEPYLPWGGIQKVPATNDLGHTAQGIVTDHCKLIGVNAVSTTEYEITTVGAQILGYRAIDPICEGDLLLRYLYPP